MADDHTNLDSPSAHHTMASGYGGHLHNITSECNVDSAKDSKHSDEAKGHSVVNTESDKVTEHSSVRSEKVGKSDNISTRSMDDYHLHLSDEPDGALESVGYKADIIPE